MSINAGYNEIKLKKEVSGRFAHKPNDYNTSAQILLAEKKCVCYSPLCE